MDGTAPASSSTFEDIALTSLRVWPDNPRRTVGDVAELAASVKAHGVLEPLLVRKLAEPVEEGHESGGPEGWVVDRLITHEVVAGQRRYLASVMAGLAVVPCRVRDLDDAAALEVALVENSQRADVCPMDEAECIGRLVSGDLNRGRTPESIADRLGRPVAWVRRRLSLLVLVEEWRADVRSGRLPLAHALALATVDAAAQRKVHQKTAHLAELPSVRLFAKEITYALHLISGAPFDVNEVDLPGGPCLLCPKRSDAGAQLDIFGTGPAAPDAHCLDTACWAKKIEVTWERVVASAKRRKLTVIEDSQGVLTSDWGGHISTLYSAPYVTEEEAAPGAKPVAVARTNRHRVVELYPRPVEEPEADDDTAAGEEPEEGDEDEDEPRETSADRRATALQKRIDRYRKLAELARTPAGLGIIARYVLTFQVRECGGDVDLRDAAEALGVTLPAECEDEEIAVDVPDAHAPMVLLVALAGGALWENGSATADPTERALRDAMEGKVAPPPAPIEAPPAAAPSKPPQRVIIVSTDGDDWMGARKGLAAWSAEKTPGAGFTSGGGARPLAMLHTPAVDSADITKILSRYEKAGRKVLDLGAVAGDKVFDCDPSNRAVREQWNAAHPSARVEIAQEKKPAAKKAAKGKAGA